jgi:hypothetical protein
VAKVTIVTFPVHIVSTVALHSCLLQRTPMGVVTAKVKYASIMPSPSDTNGNVSSPALLHLYFIPWARSGGARGAPRIVLGCRSLT